MSFFSTRRLKRASRIFDPSGPEGEKRTAPDGAARRVRHRGRPVLASDDEMEEEGDEGGDDEGEEESMGGFPVELGPTVTKSKYTGPPRQCQFCTNDAVWVFTATMDDEYLLFHCCQREEREDEMNELSFADYF